MNNNLITIPYSSAFINPKAFQRFCSSWQRCGSLAQIWLVTSPRQPTEFLCLLSNSVQWHIFEIVSAHPQTKKGEALSEKELLVIWKTWYETTACCSHRKFGLWIKCCHFQKSDNCFLPLGKYCKNNSVIVCEELDTQRSQQMNLPITSRFFKTSTCTVRRKLACETEPPPQTWPEEIDSLVSIQENCAWAFVAEAFPNNPTSRSVVWTGKRYPRLAVSDCWEP